MIYRSSYFKKELRQAYTGNKTGNNRKIIFAIFLGFISFALYFLLQTLQESVLSDVVPEIMQPSFFSTLYIYIHISFFLNAVYFIVYYDYLFFSEIRKNSWYLLVQMGYNPVSMIFSKFFALLLSVVLIYTIGFMSIILLTVFLKYSFILAYMPSLYIAGLTDLILISIFTMAVSLYVKTIINARYFIFFSAVFIIVLKTVLGYYPVLSNRVAMQNIYNLFDISRSVFLPVAAVMIIASVLVCVIRARNVAKYYNILDYDLNLPADTEIVYKDKRAKKWRLAGGGEKSLKQRKAFDTAVTVFLIVFICTLLFFNVFIILINASTPGSEVTIRGVIPFVFKSDTMEPEIMLNDLAYFKKIDTQYEVSVGEIIIFKQNNVIYVERIIEKNENNLKVDIDNYPPMSQAGAMIKTVLREAVIGVFAGRNRWLGALILFANTIFGRLLFLLVPTILLFYYKQIIDFYQRRSR
ncbi:hypothetical protein OXPF_03860 [Oxobacter pfennigii]|uniref:Signal peptidase I n=1 Tax=Oxobacter pfennigii TaxID=36849 RepID=A0A0P8WDD7_9CLOT|nr:peptidase S24 [Oxobacter pfennigii]KPU45918.1 hypothetical protein OXPF_03860 [Oxobacter pfennigii]